MAISSEAPALPRLIPLRDFFRNAAKSHFRLSPDGSAVAWLQPWRGRLNLHVQRLGSPEVTRVTAVTDRDLHACFWVSSTRLAYLRDKNGDENFRLYAVEADGSREHELTPFDGARVQVIGDPDDLADESGEILIELNRRDPKLFDAFRINTLTGEMRLVAENPGAITGWLADHDGRLRVATTSVGLEKGLLYRATEAEPFRTVLTTSFRETLTPLLFSYDNRDIYASSNLGRDKAALVRIDPATGREAELLWEHAQADILKLHRSRLRRTVTGVPYETDRWHNHFFDPDDPQARLQADIERRLPGSEIALVSLSRDETKALVRASSDRSPGTYYFHDRTSGGFELVGEMCPWLREEELCAKRPVAFPARDGLELHGYLTLPREAGKNLPVIVHPHGGPWVRDSWRYDPEVQFLANRGYGVLQVNFRSSIGFGRSFWEAGFKQWGRAMQYDLTDGARWLVAQGFADPKRIGIYGGSYGGYAALAGLAFTPEVYAAGVDYDGPSNIFTLLSSLPPYWEPFRAMMHEMVGDPEKDRELLRAASPLFSADRIRAPLLVLQGGNDPRVKKAEAEQIVAALRQRKVAVTYIAKANEGHGFSNESNRVAVYVAMEKFFARHLGGRREDWRLRLRNWLGRHSPSAGKDSGGAPDPIARAA
jgi:dipeptidyl aminopeptidase/acylaminoacyl peptidase